MARPQKRREPANKPQWDEDEQTWHGYVTVGKKEDGKPDRRHRRDKDYDEVCRKLILLEDQRDAGLVPPVGSGTVRLATWLEQWFKEDVPKTNGYSGMDIRRWAIFTHLIPGLGEHMLESLDTSYIETFYWRCYDEGLAPKSVELIHETLSLALARAVKLRMIARNPAEDAERPEPEETEFEPPGASEIIAIVRAIMVRPDRARWLTQMLGPRQGEALGLLCEDFELEDQMINVRGKLQRRTYRHGCADPAACARPHCKTKPCVGPWEHGCADARSCAQRHCNRPTYPSDLKRGIRVKPCPTDCVGHARGCPQRRRGACRRHKLACPEPCLAGCTGHARHCPQRVGGLLLVEPEPVGPAALERHKDAARPKRRGSRRDTRRKKRLAPKSRAGKRRFAIPDLFMPTFEWHFAERERRKAAAGDKWVEHGLAFCGPLGEPIDRRRDWDEWCAILEAADVEHMPLHWARHITATLLLAAGVDPRVVMDVMGWSDARMLKRYQHVADELRRDAANRLAGVIRGSATASATGTSFEELFAAMMKAPTRAISPA